MLKQVFLPALLQTMKFAMIYLSVPILNPAFFYSVPVRILVISQNINTKSFNFFDNFVCYEIYYFDLGNDGFSGAGLF